jgi:hypothetical protein
MRRRSIALLLAALVASVFATLVAHPTARSAPLEPAVFRPQALDPATEIVNPMRGLFRWNDQEVAPQPRPSYDSYRRYSWKEFEPSPGVYDFSALENHLAAAQRAGRKHSFRIRSMVLGNGMDLPEHVAGKLERGWWSRDTYIPDWNDPDFLAATEAFVRELARRYDGDPRIGYVEIGAYGTWGEWNVWPFGDDYPTPGGAQTITSENLYRLVDSYVDAFKQTPLVMMSDNKPALVHALRRSPAIGWRRDSLGSAHFADGMNSLKSDPAAWALVSERWKTAPVIAEFINPGGVSAPEVYQLSLEQAHAFHVAMVGNGNTLSWDGLSSPSKDAFLTLGRALGYRFQLGELSLPAQLTPGASFTVASAWRNAGIAPAYEDWDVMLQLRTPGSRAVAWEGKLDINLRTLLPGASATLAGESGTPPEPDQLEAQANSSTLRIEKPLAPGTYDLTIMVRDPDGYRAPLALAIEGRLEDGGYRLGSVAVGQGTDLDSLLEPRAYLPLVRR